MKVAKMAPAPMVFRSGSRLPISAQVKPPSASTAIIVGASGLISPSEVRTASRIARMR